MNFRDSEISVSNSTRWALTRIVKSTQSADAMEPRGTVDALADKILSEWIQQQHPKLAKLWRLRERIDQRAEKRVNK